MLRGTTHGGTECAFTAAHGICFVHMPAGTVYIITG